jgi:hypothetical protein
MDGARKDAGLKKLVKGLMDIQCPQRFQLDGSKRGGLLLVTALARERSEVLV